MNTPCNFCDIFTYIVYTQSKKCFFFKEICLTVALQHANLLKTLL